MGKRSKPKPSKRPKRTPFDVAETLTTPGSVERKTALIHIGIVFGIALLVRLIYLFINQSSNPLFYHPVLDARFHHDWALEIVSGNFWGNEVFFRAPLYPYLLALLYKIGGSNMAFAVVVQHVIGAGTCVLIYELARGLFSWPVALAAGLLAALYWPFIYFEGDLLIVTLIVFLDVLVLLLLYRAFQHGGAWQFLLVGIILGLSAIARPSILVFVPAIPLSLYLMNSKQKRAWIHHSIFVAVGIAIVVSPVIVRNYVVGKDFVPIASQGGVNFYIGNNPQANGSLAQVPGARPDMYGTYHGAIELAERDVGHTLKPSEVSDYYLAKGIAFFRSAPADAIALTGKKFYLFWAGVERSNSKYIQFFWKKFGLGRVPLPGFWLVGPLGLMGGVLLWPRRRRYSLLYLFVVTYMLGVVVFFVNGRFRLPVAPVLIVLAAFSLCYLYRALRLKREGLFKTMIVLAACFFVVDYDYISFRGVRSLDEAVSHYELGNAYLKMERRREALESFEAAYDMQRRYPTRGYLQIAGTVDYQIGTLYRERGYGARSIEAFERIHPKDPAAIPARRELALLYEQANKLDEAIRSHQIVLAANPGDISSLVGIARVYKRMGDKTNYNGTVSRLRSLYPGNAQVENEIRRLETAP